MNIEKFRKQSYMSLLDENRDGDITYDMNKFAELIIRECIEQGKLIQSQTIVNASEEYVSGREMGIEVFINQIKEHFGIEQ